MTRRTFAKLLAALPFIGTVSIKAAQHAHHTPLSATEGPAASLTHWRNGTVGVREYTFSHKVNSDDFTAACVATGIPRVGDEFPGLPYLTCRFVAPCVDRIEPASEARCIGARVVYRSYDVPEPLPSNAVAELQRSIEQLAEVLKRHATD